MFRPLPRCFAHRGGGALAPENTLAGIRLAAQMGFAAVEFDVMLSGDGTPVLIHDETLERTTNGRGQVALTADAQLFALDAGGGERIPRYAEAVAVCRQYDLLANVEIKPATGYERATAESVARLSVECWQGARVPPLISSFSIPALEIARDLAPQLPRGVLFERVPADWLAVVQRLQAVSLHCAAEHLSDAVLAEARMHGIPVLCYTVNREAAAQALFARGVSAIFTDRLDRFSGEVRVHKGLRPGG